MINYLFKRNKILEWIKYDIGEPPWDYYLLQNLDEKEYPRYLAKLFYLNTGEKLPLCYDFHKKAWIIDKKRCKTFNQKLQWIKLYGVTDLMRDCTDKVKVRDYVKERIGEEYLKPVLQIIGNCSPSTSGRGRSEGIPLAENDVSTYFDQINWEKLPNAFIIKCNHGCKWQYIIKDKEQFLNTPKLFEIVKKQMTGWLEQEYWCWGGFELQYKNIEPKIIIEELLRNNNEIAQEVEIYCFNGIPKIIKKVHNDIPDKLTMYDENFNCIDLKFLRKEFLVNTPIDKLTKQTFVLSKQLSQDFNFVRVDWLIFQNKIYFNEMTFTPYSGMNSEINQKYNMELGKLINLERIKL